MLTINHSHGQGHDPSALRMSGSGDALADVLAGASLSPHGSDEVGAEDGGANGSGGGAGNASTSWRCEVERCLQELGTAIDRSQRGCTRSDLDGLARRTAGGGGSIAAVRGYEVAPAHAHPPILAIAARRICLSTHMARRGFLRSS